MGVQSLIVFRIVEIGEHEILPDQQAELIAEAEELRRLIGHSAANADQAHTGLRRQPQPRFVIGATAR